VNRGRAVNFLCAVLFFFAVIVTAEQPLRAQSILDPGIIEVIRVDGAQRIEPETVRSYMRVNPGEAFSAERLDRSLKSIFATGLFADVTLHREGSTLVVTVVENPIINRVAFEGNQRIEDDILSNEVQLRSRLVFTRTKVQQDVQRILEIYRGSGRFAATVEPKVIELDQNRVDLVFEIDEGPLTQIEAIHFIGNVAYSDGTLEDEITTSEYAFWNFLSTSDTYDPQRLNFDRDLLARFYRNEGYADFTVISVVAELTDDREGFIVTFTVSEGERYQFGTYEIESSLRNLDPELLSEHVAFEEGDWYDAEEVQDTVEELVDIVGDLGFAFADVQPRPHKNVETLTIDMTFDIQEGQKVYVERIDIEGNFRTLDRVIRREFRVVEGDAFNVSKLRRSRRAIQNLGFFSAVDVDQEPGTQPDRTIIKTNVVEQSTGDLSFGFGISSQQGPIGNVGIRERNLLGKGQDLRASISVAGKETQVDVSFTEPYFLGRNLSAGVDVFRISQERTESSFDLVRIGGSLRGGYNLTDNLRQVVRYTLEHRDISSIDNDASLVVRDEKGTTLRSVIGNELMYDTRDSRFDPREGYALRFKTDLAGLGGDVRFLKNEVFASYYYSFFDNLTISVRGSGGNILGIDQDTSVADRFFLGGSNPRGFKFAGIGPRDADTDDALGGKHFYTGTVELSFPLGLPEDLAIRGRLFTDMGASWDTDDRGEDVKIQDSSSPRLTVGGGLSWESPFGPVIIDLGFAMIKEDFDETEVLSFSFGTQF
jgi:outer membrane protein insertion porin family